MQPTERLTALVSKKHEVLVRLRDVGRKQMDLVDGGDVAALLALLGAKQQLIAGLQALELELRPYYTEDPEQRAWPSAERKAECRRYAEECNALLEEIVAMEKQGAEKMTVRRNLVAEQLQQAHAATQVRNAYEVNRRRAS
jgi:hypothetical protein